jgi:hypothetical protein
VPGAEEVFDRAFALIADALTPAVRILEKKGRVDVSVLKRETGDPVVVGVVNYEYEPRAVRLVWDREPKSVEGDEGCRAELQDGELRVALPGRAAAAVFL